MVEGNELIFLCIASDASMKSPRKSPVGSQKKYLQVREKSSLKIQIDLNIVSILVLVKAIGIDKVTQGECVDRDKEGGMKQPPWNIDNRRTCRS